MDTTAFLTRQPILDKKHQLIGYDLTYLAADGLGPEPAIEQIDDVLCDLGAEWPLRSKLAFTYADATSLQGESATLLPVDKTVYVIESPSCCPEDLIPRIRELKGMGYRFAFHEFVLEAEYEPLLALANYVKVDAQAEGRLEGNLNRLRKNPSTKALAMNVDSHELFQRCREADFDLFQGYYFTRQSSSGTKAINPTQTTVLTLMDKVRAGEDVRKIEEIFKHDVALTFKLLRYINSAGFGLSVEVQSIRHAVSILGMQPLYRWLGLLLATATSSPTAPALTRTSVTRGRFCELLGAHSMSREDKDNLFIIGVFSLLDVMMENPMEQILERVALPEPVAEALLKRTGPYGPVLALVEACESHDLASIGKLTEALILSPNQINTAHLQALAWVEQLGIDA